CIGVAFKNPQWSRWDKSCGSGKNDILIDSSDASFPNEVREQLFVGKERHKTVRKTSGEAIAKVDIYCREFLVFGRVGRPFRSIRRPLTETVIVGRRVIGRREARRRRKPCIPRRPAGKYKSASRTGRKAIISFMPHKRAEHFKESVRWIAIGIGAN